MQVIIFIYTDIILLELNSLISHLDRKLSQSPRPYGFQRKRREKGTDSASHPPHYAPSWTIKREYYRLYDFSPNNHSTSSPTGTGNTGSIRNATPTHSTPGPSCDSSASTTTTPTHRPSSRSSLCHSLSSSPVNRHRSSPQQYTTPRSTPTAHPLTSSTQAVSRSQIRSVCTPTPSTPASRAQRKGLAPKNVFSTATTSNRIRSREVIDHLDDYTSDSEFTD